MNIYEIIENLATNMRKHRAVKKFSQDKLAELAGLTQQYICTLEREKANPSLKTVMKLCEALNVTPNDLLL